MGEGMPVDGVISEYTVSYPIVCYILSNNLVILRQDCWPVLKLPTALYQKIHRLQVLAMLATFQYLAKKYLQGDHSGRTKPPVDFKTEVPLWPGQARLVQAKAELLF